MTRNRIQFFGMVIAALLLSPVCRAAVDERWYVVQLQGQRAGWMVERIEEKGSTITSSTEMVFAIGRGEISIDIRMESQFVESREHKPISMRSVQQLGAMPMETRYEFTPDDVVVTSVQGDRETSRHVAYPEQEWMTPSAASEYFASQLDAGEKVLSFTTIDPLSGLEPVTSTITILEEEAVEVLGKSVLALRCELEQTVMPGVTASQHMTRDGRIVRTSMNLGGIEMTVLLSEYEIALMPLEPVELVASTLVKPSRQIENARRTREGHYELRIDSGQLPRLPDTGTQVVQEQSPQRATVIVKRGTHLPAHALDHRDTRYTQASMMIDSDDEAIKKLTKQALQGVPRDEMQQIEALRQFVHAYIDEKSLGVGFASASEVCRVREGDCSEHGVLLAAMLRAAGYPSRIANGLIYADEFVGKRGIFGYHVWTQALVKMQGQWTWVDLDATLGPKYPFDATHICLGTSALAQGETVNSMASLATLIGQLSIDVRYTK